LEFYISRINALREKLQVFVEITGTQRYT